MLEIYLVFYPSFTAAAGPGRDRNWHGEGGWAMYQLTPPALSLVGFVCWGLWCVEQGERKRAVRAILCYYYSERGEG